MDTSSTKRMTWLLPDTEADNPVKVYRTQWVSVGGLPLLVSSAFNHLDQPNYIRSKLVIRKLCVFGKGAAHHSDTVRAMMRPQGAYASQHPA